MAEPAETPIEPSGRATCLYCGADLAGTSSDVKGLCVPCSARIVPRDKAKRAPEPAKRPPVMTAPLAREALADLIATGPRSKIPEAVNELIAADKKISSWLAFVPFVGPWRIQQSEVHSTKEKLFLSWASITLTALACWLFVQQLPTPEDQFAKLKARIATEMKTLGEFANQYRAERGTYPVDSSWGHYADRADPRFFDPWGRRYRYQADPTGVTISTLGRDGVEGGLGEDADASAHFDATGAPQG